MLLCLRIILEVYRINRNMRCIEICFYSLGGRVRHLINRNMRCIEI